MNSFSLTFAGAHGLHCSTFWFKFRFSKDVAGLRQVKNGSWSRGRKGGWGSSRWQERDTGFRLQNFHYNQTNMNDIVQMNLNINRKDRCSRLISSRTGRLIISLGKAFNNLSHTNLQQLIYRKINYFPTPTTCNNLKLDLTFRIFKALSNIHLLSVELEKRTKMIPKCLKPHRRHKK